MTLTKNLKQPLHTSTATSASDSASLTPSLTPSTLPGSTSQPNTTEHTLSRPDGVDFFTDSEATSTGTGTGTSTIIPAGHGYASPCEAGTRFAVRDVQGAQVVDMCFWCLSSGVAGAGDVGGEAVCSTPVHARRSEAKQVEDELESVFSRADHFSASHTRYKLDGKPIQVGECLYSNTGEPVLKLVKDDVKIHDMTFMSCYPKMYEELGLDDHRSCAQNMFEAMRPYGMTSLTQVQDPFNVFQNTPAYSLKPLNTSRAGDVCEFEVLKGCVVAWSCCPFDQGGFNGGKVTPVEIVTGLAVQ